MVPCRRSLAAGVLALLLAAAAPGHADTLAIVKGSCAACHGEDGNSVAPTFPKLAGLQVEYLEKQLRDFMTGKRASELMAPAMAALKPADVAALAAYYAAQKPQPNTVGDAALAARGKQIFDDGNTDSGVPACVGCHQPGGAGNERYPRLAGQHQAYAAQEMRRFRSGERNNDRARVMRAVAAHERRRDRRRRRVPRGAAVSGTGVHGGLQ